MTNKRFVFGVHILFLVLAAACLGQQGTEPSVKSDVPGISRTDSVQLPVTVLDEKKRPVTNLKAENFTVYENDQQQKVSSVSLGRGPVSVGILLDNSGSMRPKQDAVIRASMRMLDSGGPQDEYFLVAFGDDAFLAEDFTSDVSRIAKAMRGLQPRGGTALYDAVSAASEHLAKQGKNLRKVLLVITDGEDNESRYSLEKAMQVLHADGAAVYAVGLLQEGNMPHRRGQKALERLTSETNGSLFLPTNPKKLEEACLEAAGKMRGQYLIEYQPSSPASSGGARRVKVEANVPDHKRVVVQTITGYTAGTGTAR